MPAASVRSNEDNNFFPNKYPGRLACGQKPCRFRWRADLATPCLLLVLITGCAWPMFGKTKNPTESRTNQKCSRAHANGEGCGSRRHGRCGRPDTPQRKRACHPGAGVADLELKRVLCARNRSACPFRAFSGVCKQKFDHNVARHGGL